MGLTDPTVPAAADPQATRSDPSSSEQDVRHRIGQLTRTLHDALRQLGYDRELMDARDNLPDARDRLAYIARVTGEAAENVLNAVDRARTVQQELSEQAAGLRDRWQEPAGGKATTPAGKRLIDQTCDFLAGVGGHADRTNAILTDIMMAQDFHDLTGQVLRRVVVLAQSLEEQLLKLLIDTTPASQRTRTDAARGLAGPLVCAVAREDIVIDQQGVDDLLASLGF